MQRQIGRELKDMVKYILDDYLEDCIEFLEANIQELEPDCLLYEDIMKVAEGKTESYGKYLEQLPKHRVKAVYDTTVREISDRVGDKH